MIANFYLGGFIPGLIVALIQSFLIKSGIAKLSPTKRCVLQGGVFGIRKMPSEILLVGLFWPILSIKNLMEWMDYTNTIPAKTVHSEKTVRKDGLTESKKL